MTNPNKVGLVFGALIAGWHLMGYAFGYVGAVLWNKLHRSNVISNE